MAKEVKIQCPKCSWEPDGQPYWQCDCGHSWDTFETAARCPACGKQHELTQCIRPAGGCDKLSPHLDWYNGLDKWVKEQVESVKEIELTPIGAPGASL